MKETISKVLRNNWIKLCVVLAAIVLAVSGSYAAYTSFNSVKRVVSTGKGNNTMFSSNYLSLVLASESDYGTRRVATIEVKEGDAVKGYKFTVQVCNYMFGNEMTYNPSDISYSFDVLAIAKDGGELPAGVTGVTVNGTALASDGSITLESQLLPTGAAKKLEYTIYIPADMKEVIKLQIVALPDNSKSLDATSSQKLASIISLSTLEPTETWTGRFIDDKSIAADKYDGFNYEIFGNGEGTVRIEWPVNLQISSWFLSDVGASAVATDGNGKNYVTFPVGGNEPGTDTPRPTAYQFQFYKNPETDMLSWNELDSQVIVSFEPQ